MKKWNVLDSHYLVKNDFIAIRSDHCLLPNGMEIPAYCVNEYKDWVDVIAITKDGEVVLVNQYRHGIRDFILEVPAGCMESDENPVDAVQRELREETGYISDTAPVLLGESYANPANATNKIYTYLMTDVYEKHGQELDDTEEIEVSLISWNDMMVDILGGKINHIYSIAAYYMAKAYIEG